MTKHCIGASRPQKKINRDPFRVWRLPNGEPWASVYRIDADYLLRFLDLADFYVKFDGSDVQSWPVPGVSDNTSRFLYYNQVLPLALSRQNKLVFHASAVEFSGFALAFFGQTGMGKSTLATSFSTNGFPFLTDDVLHLAEVENGFQVRPSVPSVRLWSDSQTHLIGNESNLAPPLMYTSKAQFLADDVIQFCNQALSIGPMYFLGEATGNIQLDRISGLEAMIALVKHSFLLDPEDRKMLKDNFKRISHLVSTYRFYQLNYPRRYDALPEVRQTIVDHAKLHNSK